MFINFEPMFQPLKAIERWNSHLEEKQPCYIHAHDDLEENGTKTESIAISVMELCMYKNVYDDAETR